jgi:hypothetical protein
VALWELAKAADATAKAQEQYARKLAEYSPSQAASLAQLDANRMLREFEQGEATAATADEMNKERDRLEKAQQPIETDWNNFKNEVSRDWNAFKASVLEALNSIVYNTKQDKIGRIDPDKPPVETFGEFLDRVYAEETERAKRAEKEMDKTRDLHDKD